MIKAEFFVTDGVYRGFSIAGHAGHAESGQDIVCAAVSAMTSLTVNVLTGRFGTKAKVTVHEKTAAVRLMLDETPDETQIVYSSRLIEGFMLEMQVLAEDFPHNVAVRTVPFSDINKKRS